MNNRILVIDDDLLVLESIALILSDFDCEVTTADSGHEGVQLALANDFDLILTDLRMPGCDGSEVVRIVREKKPQAKILLATAFAADPLAQKALELGALDIMKKPFEVRKILPYLSKLLT